MNKQECDILKYLYDNNITNQRSIAKDTKYSLGNINKILNNLINNGYITKDNKLTDKGIKLIKDNKPKNAIILAAGFGMRMVPINKEVPKGLLKVKDECLIERLIKELNEIGIKEIHIVVGFLKEKYEYLMDKYNVDLIVNRDYSETGSIYSLKLASKYINNTYILPCDIWCNSNPFNKTEINSWYLVNNNTKNTDVRLNRKQELVKTTPEELGNQMLGIAYLNNEDSKEVRERLNNNINKENSWEQILYTKDKMFIYGRMIDKKEAISINRYEQLRDLDETSDNLKSDAITAITKTLNAEPKDIKDITVLKKGMTNRSFMFTCKNQKYIMRIPGEGTEQLINRKEEADVYKVIQNRNICDDIEYINETNGYKITKFIEKARVCDPYNLEDVSKCINFLKKFHNLKLKVNHRFNIFDKINYYEELWGNNNSIYNDYLNTKDKVFSLKEYIDNNKNEDYLTHIDAVPDNFLISINDKGNEEIHLIDWEYASMQDQDVDIAMFAIYALYDKEQVDKLIDIYFDNNCSIKTRIKIYCYIASCGLLWSNWCEYKRNLGVEFGEYSLKQYRYAKDYYNYAKELMNELN